MMPPTCKAGWEMEPLLGSHSSAIVLYLDGNKWSTNGPGLRFPLRKLGPRKAAQDVALRNSTNLVRDKDSIGTLERKLSKIVMWYDTFLKAFGCPGLPIPRQIWLRRGALKSYCLGFQLGARTDYLHDGGQVTSLLHLVFPFIKWTTCSYPHCMLFVRIQDLLVESFGWHLACGQHWVWPLAVVAVVNSGLCSRSICFSLGALCAATSSSSTIYGWALPTPTTQLPLFSLSSRWLVSLSLEIFVIFSNLDDQPRSSLWKRVVSRAIIISSS